MARLLEPHDATSIHADQVELRRVDQPADRADREARRSELTHPATARPAESRAPASGIAATTSSAAGKGPARSGSSDRGDERRLRNAASRWSADTRVRIGKRCLWFNQCAECDVSGSRLRSSDKREARRHHSVDRSRRRLPIRRSETAASSRYLMSWQRPKRGSARERWSGLANGSIGLDGFNTACKRQRPRMCRTSRTP